MAGVYVPLIHRIGARQCAPRGDRQAVVFSHRRHHAISTSTMSPAGPIVPALVGRNIHKTFLRDDGEVARALDNVSVEVRRGVVTALVGPDGVGKTTLIRLAAGWMFADCGELKVLGTDVASDPHQIQARIGYMPQRFGLYEDLSVQENLDLYADMHGIGADEPENVIRD